MTALTGIRAIEETIQSNRTCGPLYVCVKNKRISEIAARAKIRGIKVIETSKKELEALTGGQPHRGAALVVSSPQKSANLDTYISALRADSALVVVLDGITDPHNFGAIIRSADQFSADCVVVPGRRAAAITPVVVSSSAGASNYVRIIRVPNLVRALEKLKKAGFWVYGADMSGQNVGECSLSGRVALVLGSEGKGLGQLIKKTCDVLARIPTTGNVESLNVSVAAGIFLYEIRRQKAEMQP